MTKEEIRKKFEEAGGEKGTGYMRCWFIAYEGFERFLEAVAGGGTVPSAGEMTSEVMFYALRATRGYQSEQDRAAAMVKLGRRQ